MPVWARAAQRSGVPRLLHRIWCKEIFTTPSPALSGRPAVGGPPQWSKRRHTPGPRRDIAGCLVAYPADASETALTRLSGDAPLPGGFRIWSQVGLPQS